MKKIFVPGILVIAVFQKLSLYYYKPELLYQQDAYMLWVKNLVAAIKKADPDRSVTVDVEVSENLNALQLKD